MYFRELIDKYNSPFKGKLKSDKMSKLSYLVSLTSFMMMVLMPSCKKEKLEGPLSELPPATQEGAHTFGCLINGKPWVAHLDPGVFTPSIREITSGYNETVRGVSSDYFFKLISTRITYSDSLDQSFAFFLKPIKSIGIIDLNNLEVKDIAFRTSIADGLGTDLEIYYLDTLYNNNLEITALNTESNYISGLFDFRFVDDKGLDTLDVTEGRFDVRYQPY